MDEAQSLDELARLLEKISHSPYNVSLHSQYIRLADTTEGMETEALSAREMMSNFLLCCERVWIPVVESKRATADLNTAEGIFQVLDLYVRAEMDYLSIPLLLQHLEFIVEKHAQFSFGAAERPEGLGEILSTDWTREEISNIVGKGIEHLTQSHLLWDIQRDWEMSQLEASVTEDRAPLVERVQLLHLTRLRQPHSTLEDTAQSYSTFTTNYKPPAEYESLLVSASKIRSQGTKAYERRESFETNLVQSNNSLDTFARYIAAERRARYPDLFVLKGVYERAIAQAAKQQFEGDAGAEAALRAFWIGYCDTLRLHEAADEEMELQVFKRATKSVPGSGEVWARYIRYLERVVNSQDVPADHVYDKAMSTNLIQLDPEQIVPLTLAWAGHERRRIEAGAADEEAFATLINVLQQGISLVRKASLSGDPRFRLEKNLADIYLRLADLPDQGAEVWHQTARHLKSSYLAWTSYIDILIKQDKHDTARAVYKDIHTKNLDWPEVIWDAWLTFEHLYGTVQDIEYCLDRIEKAQYQVNMRRAKEAEKASYQAAQMVIEPAANAPVAETIQTESGASGQQQTVAMDVDVSLPELDSSKKRKAENEPTPPAESHKKAKTTAPPPPLKRDRENCTVFVSDLPDGVTEENLTTLFKDCGKIREVKITKLPSALVATVEFNERDSVPAALTKDKKRVLEQEISVHLAWKSTLYVTNFPEKSDDASIRELFGKYGTLFDVRWPSKKFKNTRRFCYVQYTSPGAAQEALLLHGLELEPGLALNVYTSNPERRKERTDQDANEKEVYVAGLSKFTSKDDLVKIFKTYGPVKDVRMATFDDGHCKGFAFIEFEDEGHAQAALAANNYELKKRRIAVTMANQKVRAKERRSGLSKRADERNRSVRVRGLPPATQEGLLHQTFEKLAPIKRVEVFQTKGEAVVELQNAADVGKLLLRTEAVEYEGHVLQLSEELSEQAVRSTAPLARAGGLFVPRSAASRRRAGLGHSRGTKKPPTNIGAVASASSSQSSQGKGQDDFRKMLG
ncbi:Splicing factor [Pleurotus ostreatus]|uniref:U4/U6 snRNA-associated-splicing factor PRP24 n=1 Tax=Pleurotus ostreatus TaxID=5322 RepID=A0A8H6ZKK7_PLEOS|nr:Splicing factor [Pleurotus ostreatus]KAF7422665.1 Splicing factor [Pleurotus ostreatus]